MTQAARYERGNPRGIDDHPVWRGLEDRPRHGHWARYQDPVLGYISLPPLLLQALDLRRVQHLRGIKQLSGLDLVFPGASHTRFEHSVGVMWLAGLAHDALLRKRGYRSDWPRLNVATKLAVMLAGLFHDLGHGPYSHVYEMFLEMEPHPETPADDGEDVSPTETKKTTPHTRSTKKIIETDPEIGKFLLGVVNAIRETVHEDAALVEPEQIKRIAIGWALPMRYRMHSFLGQMISGEFDVDRLDYLRRDSVHTGVPMGLDTGEIVAAYTLAKVSLHEPDYEQPIGAEPVPMPVGATADDDKELRWVLKLDWTAAEAFEGMLVTRDTAYRRLYYERAHRSGTAMLILSMQRLTRRHPEPEAKPGFVIPPEALGSKKDAELLAMIDDHADEAKDSVLRVLYDAWQRRELYEPLPRAIRIDRWPAPVILELKNFRERANPTLRERMRAVIPRVGMLDENDDFEDARAEHPPERILIDMTRTPVSGATAYRGRWLWDEREGKRVPEIVQLGGEERVLVRRTGYSLNELLSHMNTLHGVRLAPKEAAPKEPGPEEPAPETITPKEARTERIAGQRPTPEPAEATTRKEERPQTEDLHGRYEAQMQTILIFLPGSFMKRLHEAIIEERQERTARQAAERLYRSRIAPIVDALYATLTEKVEQRPAQTDLFMGFEDEILRWLESDRAFPEAGEREVWVPFA